jgi:peptidoglycan/LPS O-acetylase OafA/YrhL
VDAFGTGGFLAWWYARPRKFPIHYVFFALAILLTPYWMAANTRFAATFLPLRTLVSITCCALICIGLSYRIPNEIGKRTDWAGAMYKTWVFIGKISYGMYVYHFPLPYAFRFGAKLLGQEAVWMGLDITAQFWLMLPVLVGLSYASFALIELPLQRLGKRLVPSYTSPA